MDAVSAANTYYNAGNADTTSVAKKSLGSEDFLKLLTVQLSNQDPLNPMEDTEFISQMANFTSLQQMSELSTSFKEFSAEQQRMSAAAYLGREVTILPEGGEETIGTVSAVSRDEEGVVTVTINGNEYDIGDIRRVALPAPTTED